MSADDTPAPHRDREGLARLRADYGGGKGKRRDLINRAIRQDLMGGDDLLSALPLLHQVARKLGHVADKDPGSPEAQQHELAQQAHDLACRCRDLMAEEIAARYGVDP